ncbi:MAG: mechanosensitive ion channel domain-containing protein [Haloarculaceae archaeon]
MPFDPPVQTGIDWPEIIRRVFSEETVFWLAILVLVAGIVVSYFAWRWTRRLLLSAGVQETVEGTPFERTVRSFGTSTVGVVALLVAVFVYLGTVILAIDIAQVVPTTVFWSQLTGYLPRLFIAALAVIAGLVLGDKAGVMVSERLKSIKLPEVELIPELVKYSIFYIAALVALGQLGIAISALLVLLVVYTLGLVLLSLVAFWDLLRAGAAGVYLLLNQPYGIGDRIRVDGSEGIVQEVDVFTTHIESEGEEYIVPNQKVLQSGVVRVRE